VQVLTRISAVHGLPEQIVVDNGPEFIGNALDAWAYERGINFSSFGQGSQLIIVSWKASTADSAMNA